MQKEQKVSNRLLVLSWKEIERKQKWIDGERMTFWLRTLHWYLCFYVWLIFHSLNSFSVVLLCFLLVWRLPVQLVTSFVNQWHPRNWLLYFRIRTQSKTSTLSVANRKFVNCFSRISIDRNQQQLSYFTKLRKIWLLIW